MSLEVWKQILDWFAVVLVGLTFLTGAAALVIGKILNDRQAEQLRKFDKDLTATKITLADSQRKAAEAQLALRKNIEYAVTPRRIIMGIRNNDQEIRQVKFKELEKYADTPAIIVYVRDEEAEILAFDIRNVLAKAGWKSVSIMDLTQANLPLGFIQAGVQVRTLQKVNGEHAIPTAPVIGTLPSPMEAAIIDFLHLDLGVYGVQWQPDAIVNGRPIGVLLRYGFKIPDNGVVITVGTKPTELYFQIHDFDTATK